MNEKHNIFLVSSFIFGNRLVTRTRPHLSSHNLKLEVTRNFQKFQKFLLVAAARPTPHVFWHLSLTRKKRYRNSLVNHELVVNLRRIIILTVNYRELDKNNVCLKHSFFIFLINSKSRASHHCTFRRRTKKKTEKSLI